MRTKNDSLIQKSNFGVLFNQISFSKKYSYERKLKTRFEAKLTTQVISISNFNFRNVRQLSHFKIFL